MVRIAGVDVPDRKRAHVALRSIYGIGPKIAEEILIKASLDPITPPRMNELSEEQVDLIRELVVPTWNAVAFYMLSNYPWFVAIFSRIFREKIKQAHRKYLSGNTNGEQFFRFKTYRLFLYQLYEMH